MHVACIKSLRVPVYSGLGPTTYVQTQNSDQPLDVSIINDCYMVCCYLFHDISEGRPCILKMKKFLPICVNAKTAL